MTEALRKAILAGDAAALEMLVLADPDHLHANVSLGDGSTNAVPPLHLVCDAVFRRLVTEEQALALANVLLEAGVDREHGYAKSGDTYLIAAASLGAESVGLRLVELGADVTRRGLFGATALHWAAFMGLERLTHALLEAGAELERADAHYDCTPLQWALFGWCEGTNGRRAGLPGVAAALVASGARVSADAHDSLAKDSDREMRAALGLDGAG